MAVIGTGLIGTSVALAARQQGITVYLSDRNEHHARTASALGAGVIARPREPVDLAIIAVPPSEVGPVLVQQQALRTADCYTDVAAVKQLPEQHVLQNAAEPFRYVGGHPMAGSERSGPRAGRADLFRGRAWALTPSAFSGDAALARGLELLEVCGAAPVLMDSRLHDERMALTSHVPHVMASLTAAQLVGTPDQVPVLVGRGFRDATRIARGEAMLWSDILTSNAASIAAVLTELQDDLASLVNALIALTAGDDNQAALATVTDLLERGIAGLAGIPDTGPDTEILWLTALAEQAALRRSVSEPTVQQ